MGEEKVIAIYSRKSKYTGKGESIENQIQLCKQYINIQNGKDAVSSARIYEDEGFSGMNLERPQFKKMMSDVKAGIIKEVIVYRIDRISRNIGDFANLIEELDNMEISFVSIKEQFDTSSPMGRAMMFISSVFSQLERETISERIRDNMQELSKTGRWLGGTTPTGYSSERVKRTGVDGKVRYFCKLKIVAAEAEIVKCIFDIFTQTHSFVKTESYLLKHECKTKNNKTFSRFSIKAILSNPVYMIADSDAYNYLTKNNVELFSDLSEFDGKYGVISYNRTIQKKGRSNKTRPVYEWIVSVGKHEGIISGTQWIKAQKIMEQNRSRSHRKPRSSIALMSGLIFCGKCGCNMRPKLSSRKDEFENFIYTYICTKKEKSRSQLCRTKNADGNKIDRAVIEEIMKIPDDDDVFIRLLRKSKKGLVDDPSFNNLTSDEFDMLSQQLSSLIYMINDMTVEQKREAIRRCVRKVIWDGQDIHIYMYGSEDDF